MRKGYQNLIETLALLMATEKSRESIEHFEIMVANNSMVHRFKPTELTLTTSELFGQSTNTWIQIPLDELVGLGVAFKADFTKTLPVALAEARERRPKVPIKEVA